MKHNYFISQAKWEIWEELLSNKMDDNKKFLIDNYKNQVIDTICFRIDGLILDRSEYYVFKLKCTEEGTFKVYCSYHKVNMRNVEYICSIEDVDVEEDEHFDFSLYKPFKCCGHKLNLYRVNESVIQSILWSSFIKDDMNYYEKIQHYELLNFVMRMYEIKWYHKLFHYFF